jgi:hypothetical protein
MTAVEWYAKQMQLKEQFTQEEFNNITNQAKEMEKQQIQDAYRINPNNEIWSNSGIGYYNEQFKNK